MSVTPAINKRQAVGNCDTGPDKQSITVIYSVNQTALNVTFNFVMDNKMYHMNSFSLKALIDGHSIDGWLTVFHFSVISMHCVFTENCCYSQKTITV